VKLSSIGDVTQTLPALYSLRKGLEKGPEGVEIDWLVEEPSSTLLKGNPLINNLIVVKNRGWTADFASSVRTVRFLRSRGYDMVLDFQGLMKSALWVLLSGGKRRIGFANGREFSRLALNEKVAPYDPDRHAVDRYLDLARYAGGVGRAGGVVFPLNITEEETERVRELLRKKGIEGDSPFFSIVSRARWKTKLWSDSSFASFARGVVKRGKLHAVLTGKAEDRTALEALRAEAGDKAVNLAGELDLKELSALFKLSSFVLAVDSGPMHIAAAAGAKVIALFGPTAPWRTGPYGEGHLILRKEMDCSPCFRRRCPHGDEAGCMSAITVEEAIEAAGRLLSEGTFL